MATQQVKVNERLAALTAGGDEHLARRDRPAPDPVRASSGGSFEEDCLRGVTSNPTIFSQAILGSDDYDEQLDGACPRRPDYARDLPRARDQGHPEAPVTCCDRSTTTTERYDGYVSLEVDPDLAFTPSARWSRRGSTGSASTART